MGSGLQVSRVFARNPLESPEIAPDFTTEGWVTRVLLNLSSSAHGSRVYTLGFVGFYVLGTTGVDPPVASAENWVVGVPWVPGSPVLSLPISDSPSISRSLSLFPSQSLVSSHCLSNSRSLSHSLSVPHLCVARAEGRTKEKKRKKRSWAAVHWEENMRKRKQRKEKERYSG